MNYTDILIPYDKPFLVKKIFSLPKSIVRLVYAMKLTSSNMLQCYISSVFAFDWGYLQENNRWSAAMYR